MTPRNISDDSPECMEKILQHYGWDGDRVLDSRWVTVLCPFHHETDPSAGACSTGFSCHACGTKGSCITLIMEVEKCDVRRALQIIEELTGESYRKVSEPVTRKSWGIPPFGERPRSRDDGSLPSWLRR